MSKTNTYVTAVEGTLAFQTIKHHNSYRSMDCMTGLLRKIFPDSLTAQKISSACTKTEAIVNAVIVPPSVEVTLKAIKEIQYFGVSTKGRNSGAEKYSTCSFNILIERIMVYKVN
ncbi:unnamed protein product [Lepeophtheirus salmonis]|uniref:(salmon louse) hypothetical protein n=1 Tax=Lepeophtheirus salmonis TaxID=72036 RepID=A0A7R8D688_LEPSM|nr:unnamed protein product [Lepeophtheirus salmonis]CAF3041380.1 unnamed protein product [Lepeophtheirus salmonis]